MKNQIQKIVKSEYALKFSIFLNIILMFIMTIHHWPFANFYSKDAKRSYVIGFQVGENIKNQKLNLVPEKVSTGLEESLNNKFSRFSSQEMNEVYEDIQKEEAERLKLEAEKNLKLSQEFLAKNKTQEGWHETASGLQFKVIKDGTGKKVNPNDTVQLHYIGQLIDGSIIDSAYADKNVFEVKISTLLKVWSEALQKIKVGGAIEIAIPPELAYGEKPRPGIPPQSVLKYKIELVGVK